MRLAKYLAHAGVASRRTSEDLIAAGRVTLDGERVTDPARAVEPGVSAITVDGKAVAPEHHEVWLVNKPAGVVSTASEPGRRQPVTDLVASDLRLYPVGRLDVDTTGLILLTNDGELANRLMHPRYGVPKTYWAKLERPPTPRQLERLRKGVKLEDGPTAPAVVRQKGDRAIEITLREGRKRQIKRMLDRVGNPVESLRRVSFGSLQLGDLRLGSARRLSAAEVKGLWKDAAAVDRGRK